jgi:hypothetical protein
MARLKGVKLQRGKLVEDRERRERKAADPRGKGWEREFPRKRKAEVHPTKQQAAQDKIDERDRKAVARTQAGRAKTRRQDVRKAYRAAKVRAKKIGYPTDVLKQAENKPKMGAAPRGGGRAKASATRARNIAKSKAAGTYSGGKGAKRKQSLKNRLRIAAARVPLAAAYGARGGGGRGGTK